MRFGSPELGISTVGRCEACALPNPFCLCSHVTPLATRTRVVVIRHARELRKPSGTARIAKLALSNLEVVDYRDESGDTLPPWLIGMPDRLRPGKVCSPAEVAEHLTACAPVHLLFPTGRALTEAAPRTLVVLDGTWRQARAMYQRIPGLAALPAVALAGARSPQRRLRTSHRDGDRSTFEAIAEALTILEGEEVGAPLFELHARFVEHSLGARGRLGPGFRPGGIA